MRRWGTGVSVKQYLDHASGILCFSPWITRQVGAAYPESEFDVEKEKRIP